MNGLQISIVILSVAFALLGFFLCVSILGGVTQDKRRVEKRVNKIASKKSGLTLQIQEKKKERKSSILKRAIDGSGKLDIPFLTELVALDKPNWYYFVADYEQWRISQTEEHG